MRMRFAPNPQSVTTGAPLSHPVTLTAPQQTQPQPLAREALGLGSLNTSTEPGCLMLSLSPQIPKAGKPRNRTLPLKTTKKTYLQREALQREARLQQARNQQRSLMENQLRHHHEVDEKQQGNITAFLLVCRELKQGMKDVCMILMKLTFRALRSWSQKRKVQDEQLRGPKGCQLKKLEVLGLLTAALRKRKSLVLWRRTSLKFQIFKFPNPS